MPPARRHNGMTLLRGWRRYQFGFLVILSCAFVLFSNSRADAQSEANRATARALAAEGYEALQQEDYVTAEDRFRRADELVHAPTLVVDHARALTGLGMLVEAHERYELVLREGIGANAPWVWKRALEDAQTEVEALKPRLAWLVIVVDYPDEPQVVVDGQTIPIAALGVARATNPGERNVEVSAPGFVSQTTELSLAEGEQRELRFVLEQEERADEPEAVSADGDHAVSEQSEPEFDDERRRRRLWAYGSLGIGGTSLIVGGVAGALFISAGNELDATCPSADTCPERVRDDVKAYRRFGWVTGVGLGVGVVGLATGIYLLVTEEAEAKGAAQTQRPSIAPMLTAETVGVWGEF